MAIKNPHNGGLGIIKILNYGGVTGDGCDGGATM